MDSASIRRSGAFPSGRPAALALAATLLLAATVGAAGAASLAIDNQASRSVTVKAFSGGSCAPQMADRVLRSATLTMTCPIREVCATFDTFLSPGGATGLIDIYGGEDIPRTCRLSANGSNIVWTLNTRASDGTACDFRWNSIPGDASSSLALTCTNVIN